MFIPTSPGLCPTLVTYVTTGVTLYAKIKDVDTALCNKMMHNAACEFALPSGIHIRIPIVLAFDNID